VQPATRAGTSFKEEKSTLDSASGFLTAPVG
jgi:hypothetical protein